MGDERKGDGEVGPETGQKGRTMAELDFTPSAQEIMSLPHWAQIALVARSARRLQPMTGVLFSSGKRATEPAVEAVIRSIEVSAASGRSATPEAIEFSTGTSEVLSEAAACLNEGLRSLKVPLSESAVAASHSVMHAILALSNLVDNAIRTENLLGIRLDFELLRQVALEEKWTDETPVPPEFFGPRRFYSALSPFGPPSTPPKDFASQARMPEITLEFEVPDNVDPNEADAAIGQIIEALSDLHTAMGGSGLEIADGIAYEPAMELAPVGPEGDEQ